MANYPKIIIDETKNSPVDVTKNFSVEHYYDFMHHTHKMSDIVDDSESVEIPTYDDTELRELLEGKVDAVEGKSLVDDAEIERLAGLVNYDDSQIREDMDAALDDLFNKIMGITDEDSTTVDEAYDTLKEVSKYITEDGSAAAELVNKVAAIEEALKAKLDAVEGKSLVDDAEIARLAEVSNYDDTAIKEALEGKVDTEEGKSLLADTEIERLAGLSNYDDTEIKEAIEAIVPYNKETAREDLVSDHYIDKRGEPYLNEEYNCFFANGVPVTVEEDPDNADGVIIKWGVVGVAKIADASTLYVYGGSDGYVTPKYIPHTKVTVNSGNVRCLYAGGCANCVVDNAEVIVNGGTVKNIMGGGRSSDRRDPINRSAVVYNSKVIMNGGDCSMLVGGSVGYGITENVSITLNDGTVAGYLIAGGSNGAVEHAEININGGTTKLFQSTNRGYVTDVEFNMTGGSVTNAYCGGEPVSDVDGTIKSFKCNITGGTIETLAVGTDGSTAAATGVEYVEVPMRLDKISGTLAEGVVTTISEELKNKLQ